MHRQILISVPMTRSHMRENWEGGYKNHCLVLYIICDTEAMWA